MYVFCTTRLKLMLQHVQELVITTPLTSVREKNYALERVKGVIFVSNFNAVMRLADQAHH